MTIALVVAATTVVVIGFLNLVAGAPWFQFPLSAVLAYAISMAMLGLTDRLVALSLPAWYMTLRPCERKRGAYRRFGVDLFKRMLVATRIDACNWLVRFSQRRGDLQALAQGMRRAETHHALSFLVVTFAIVYAGSREWYWVSGWLVLINVLANVYPIALQRHNRARVLALLDRPRRSRSRATKAEGL